MKKILSMLVVLVALVAISCSNPKTNEVISTKDSTTVSVDSTKVDSAIIVKDTVAVKKIKK